MDFDNVLAEIGEFGKYQRTNYLLICLPVMFAAANSLSYVFTAGIPNYRCLVPQCDNAIDSNYYEDWVINALPVNTDSTPEQCLRYEINPMFENDTALGTCPASQFFNKTVSCNEWVFDNSDKTIVQEWGITCFENQYKLALVGTLHFAGLVFGTAVSGVLADKYGRKLIFICCILFMSITGILQGLAWDYISFCVFAFLNAVGTSGVYPLAFIIGVEMVGLRKREMSSVVLNYFYAVGEAAVGLIAWLSGDWKILQLVLSTPPILFVLYYWLVPESVRWLLAKDEHQQASTIIKKAARINGKELSQAMIATIDKSHNDKIDRMEKFSLEQNSYDEDQDKNKILKAFIMAIKSKILLFRFVILFYLWATNSFVYYGLSLNSTNLSGNKFLNFSLVCLIEIPGYTLAWIILNKFGRKWSLSLTLLLSGLTCGAGGFISKGLTWAITTLFLIGKLAITASFTIIYVYTAEMMPTVIRSGGVGAMSTMARCAAMLAPFVPLLSIYYKPLPLLTFASVSLLGSALSLLLPETFRKKLPDTVREAERIGNRTDDDYFDEDT